MNNNNPLSEKESELNVEILKVELLRNKISAFREATEMNNAGLSAMTESEAKQEIFDINPKEENPFSKTKTETYDEIFHLKAQLDATMVELKRVEKELAIEKDASYFYRLTLKSMVDENIKNFNPSFGKYDDIFNCGLFK